MKEISVLKAVNLREAWSDETQDFTPWLVDHLNQLGDKLDLAFESVEREKTLPGAGRVDIFARQVGTDANVVIENQLGQSDDSHCLRLLGYAANADANILVWVAHDFTDYHRSILSWLNESDNIAIYAVAVRAYQVGNALAADFDIVVEPPQSQSGTSAPNTNVTMSTHYANFYRPVVERLRRSGLPPVGRGGWRGRWRSFQSGYPKVVYGTGLDDGKAWIFFDVYGAENQHIYRALIRYQSEIEAKLDSNGEWHEGAQASWFGMFTEADISDQTVDHESVGEWIFVNLLRLKDVVQPYLKKVMADIGTPDVSKEETL